jgi:hypothetical protein
MCTGWLWHGTVFVVAHFSSFAGLAAGGIKSQPSLHFPLQGTLHGFIPPLQTAHGCIHTRSTTFAPSPSSAAVAAVSLVRCSSMISALRLNSSLKHSQPYGASFAE